MHIITMLFALSQGFCSGAEDSLAEIEKRFPKGTQWVSKQFLQQNTVTLNTSINDLPEVERAPYLDVVRFYLETLPQKEKTRIEILEEKHPGLKKELGECVVRYKQDWKKVHKRIKNFIGFDASISFLKNLYREITAETTRKKSVKFTKEQENLLVSLVREHGRK